jgi:hypothetical protein
MNVNATAAVTRNAIQRLISAEGGAGDPQKKQLRPAAASWRSAVTALSSMGDQAAHSSNRRMISMSLHPNRMREPHNMKGMQ